MLLVYLAKANGILSAAYGIVFRLQLASHANLAVAASFGTTSLRHSSQALMLFAELKMELIAITA